MKLLRSAVILAALLSIGSIGQTQVNPAPTLINFQGRLATPAGVPVADGNYSIRFSLWNIASGGTVASNEKWTQTIASVQVKNGTFAVLLNTATANLFNENLWLEIKVENAAAQTPRQQIVSAPYAIKANSVADGSILTTSLANNAVTVAKINADAVTPAKIANDNASLSKVSGGLLSIGGNQLNYPGGVIKNTAGSLGTSDLGLYSQVSGQWMRFVTNAAPFRWYSDSGAGTTPLMTLNSSGFLGINNGSPDRYFSLNAGNNSYPFLINGSSTIGTWMQLQNTSTGGRTWSIISTGSGNGEGTGNLVFNAQGVSAATLRSTGEFVVPIVTVTGGSDVAEPYHIAKNRQTLPLPGMVVCIDSANVGRMKVSGKAYDKTVAGIISGANGIRPGITLSQKGTIADGTHPVASIGRVWCWCDADANGAIEAGDMLTTSKTPGHAMKVTRFGAANGAVIGKAMSNLKRGKGLVLVLVSLK